MADLLFVLFVIAAYVSRRYAVPELLLARRFPGQPERIRDLQANARRIGLAAMVLGWVLVIVYWDWAGDWRAYYDAARTLDLTYVAPLNTYGAYLYSPAFAQVLWPLAQLPDFLFAAGFAALNVGALSYLAGPILGPLAILFPPVFGELTHGNIHLLMAAAVAVGFRAPGAWALVLLTKGSPALALIWFVLRRRWRAVGWVAATTALVVVCSMALDASAWVAWIGSLVDNTTIDSLKAILPWPRWLRWGIGLAVAVGGAVFGLRWAVVVAAMFTVPIFWAATITMLLGTLPLADLARREADDSRSQG